ncbi:MAG: hypothetical protein M1457_12790 [bacterium]|nr:hypothetical protein [bacterium]
MPGQETGAPAITQLFAECYGSEAVMSPHIAAKAEWVTRMLPARAVVDVGGMWMCNGYYSFVAAAHGGEEVVLLDTQATEKFHQINRRMPEVRWVEIDFYRGLKNGAVAALGADRPAEALICYDILLHQPEPLAFVAEMMDAFEAKRAVIGNPAMRRSAGRHDLVFAPHNEKFARRTGFKASADLRDRGGWVWLFSHGYLLSMARYLGLRVVDELLLRQWYPRSGLAYSLLHVERA